jgi:membrane-associated phospholipid phosphatase
MIGFFAAYPTASLRSKLMHIAYAIWMFLAALYLDHHWVLDALVGQVVAFTAVKLANAYLSRQPSAEFAAQLERS